MEQNGAREISDLDFENDQLCTTDSERLSAHLTDFRNDSCANSVYYKRKRIDDETAATDPVPKKATTANDVVLDVLNEFATANQNNFEQLLSELKRLQDKVTSLEQKLEELKPNAGEDPNEILKKPFENRKDFVEFDKSLADDSEKMNLLMAKFARCGGDDVNHFVRKNLQKLITDKVATQLCWSGTINKMMVKNFNSILALKKICLSTIPNSTETAIDYHTKRFFHYAQQRVDLSNKY